MKNQDEVKPIVSQSETDFYFTDPHHQLGQRAKKKGQKNSSWQKKPWFTQKMNKRGRLLQLVMMLALTLLGLRAGLFFLHVPLSIRNIQLLVQHGYQGPYQGLQIIDIDLHPIVTATSNQSIASLTLYNFDKVPYAQALLFLEIDFVSTEPVTQEINCCKNHIPPDAVFTLQTHIQYPIHEIQSITPTIAP
ncbi:MAG: hypothetical protein R3A45_01230 [Bdellovibrionota bacterium]